MPARVKISAELVAEFGKNWRDTRGLGWCKNSGMEESLGMPIQESEYWSPGQYGNFTDSNGRMWIISPQLITMDYASGSYSTHPVVNVHPTYHPTLDNYENTQALREVSSKLDRMVDIRHQRTIKPAPPAPPPKRKVPFDALMKGRHEIRMHLSQED